jgi:hypothetical protein
MPKETFIAIADDLKEAIEIDDKIKLYIHKHALRRIQSRRISIASIRDTFRNPDIIIPNKKFENARNYVKTVDNNKLKIGVKDQDEALVLITVFFQGSEN